MALEPEPFRGCNSRAQPLHDLATTARLGETAARHEQRIGRGGYSGLADDDRLLGHLDGRDGVGQLASRRGARVTGRALKCRGTFALHEGGVKRLSKGVKRRPMDLERTGQLGLGRVLGQLPEAEDDAEPEAAAHRAAPMSG